MIGLIFFSFIDFFNDPFHKDFYLKRVSFHIEPRRRVHDVKFVSLFVVNFSLQEEESTKDTEHWIYFSSMSNVNDIVNMFNKMGCKSAPMKRKAVRERRKSARKKRKLVPEKHKSAPYNNRVEFYNNQI